MTEKKPVRRPRRIDCPPVSTNYVQDLVAINDAVEKSKPKLEYIPDPSAGVWTGSSEECPYVSKEDAVVEWVLRMGKEHGYGNLIRHLREAWVDSLVSQGVSPETAVAAAWVSPRSRRDRGFIDVHI